MPRQQDTRENKKRGDGDTTFERWLLVVTRGRVRPGGRGSRKPRAREPSAPAALVVIVSLAVRFRRDAPDMNRSTFDPPTGGSRRGRICIRDGLRGRSGYGLESHGRGNGPRCLLVLRNKRSRVLHSDRRCDSISVVALDNSGRLEEIIHVGVLSPEVLGFSHGVSGAWLPLFTLKG